MKNKTIGQCLRNNWNSINDSNGIQRRLRISIQNEYSCSGKFDKDLYLNYLWNEEVEINETS